jgi:hypothetical protein
MESQRLHPQPDQKQAQSRFATRGRALLSGSILFFASLAVAGNGQSSQSPRPIVIPNRTLGPDEMRNLNDKSVRKRSFDAANAARKKAIDDATVKLVLLARDLKSRTDNLGSDAPSQLMLREAAMIEILANDVKEKMKLVINPE